MFCFVFFFAFSSHSDTDRPFLEMHSEIPEIIYMTEGREVVIPCRVTSPNVTVTLKKVKPSNASLRIPLLQMSTVNSSFCRSGMVFLQTLGLLSGLFWSARRPTHACI